MIVILPSGVSICKASLVNGWTGLLISSYLSFRWPFRLWNSLSLKFGKTRYGFKITVIDYLDQLFTFNDLKRLSKLCKKLDSKGCKFMLSNSNSEEVLKIFSNNSWKVFEIEANRSINSDSRKRTGHSELLIKNY